MLYPGESRIEDVIRRWNQADELYEDLRDEAEEAIRQYDELERMYEGACYDLHEAEDRIAELETEIQQMKETGNKKYRGHLTRHHLFSRNRIVRMGYDTRRAIK